MADLLIPDLGSVDTDYASLRASGQVKPITPEPKAPGILDATKAFAAEAGNNMLEEAGAQPFNPLVVTNGLATTILAHNQPNSKDSLLTKVGKDVVSLGAGIPLALGHPINTLMNLPTGLIQGVQDLFTAKQWADHPLLNLVNAVTSVTGIGGAIEKGIASASEKAGVAAVQDAAVQAGIDATKITTGSLIKASPLRVAIDSMIRQKNPGLLVDTIKNHFIEQGATEEAATTAANTASEAIGNVLVANATKAGLGKVLAKPFTSAAEAAAPVVTPLKELVFGRPAESAVGQMYGAEVVAKNPSGFSNIESWASKQAIERGLPDTVENRLKMMNDWSSTNPEWSLLTPEERVQYQRNYINASEAARNISTVIGKDVVPTRFLAPEDVQAIVKTIENHSDESATNLWESLKKDFGSDLSIYDKQIQTILKTNPTTDVLAGAIVALGRGHVLDPRGMGAVIDAIEKVKKETGYNIVEAPTDHPISYASESGTLPSVATDVAYKKSALANAVEQIGLSPHGLPEGTLEAVYRDKFTQNAMSDLSAKYPNGIEVTGRIIPVKRLFTFLDNAKYAIGSSRHGIKAIIRNVYSVAEIDKADLVRLGMKPKDAAAIEKVIKETLSPINPVDAFTKDGKGVPAKFVGVADAAANWLSANVPGYASFIKAAYLGRYHTLPFFTARVYFKTQVLRALRGAPVTFGSWSDRFLQKTVGQIPYLKDLVSPKFSDTEAALMHDEVIKPLQKNIIGSNSNPDIQEITSFDKKAEVGKTLVSENIYNRIMGYSMAYDATGMAKALAAKYGMSLTDALGYDINHAGIKVYKNPSVANMIKDATEAVYHYQPGVLTSPLMRTLNTIWFPARFESKVVSQTARWLSNLSPMAKVMVMSDWTHFANFISTPEGIAWRKQNQGVFQNALDYLLPYEEIGHSIQAVMKGKLFSGDVGLLGGIPFGFMVNALQDLALIPSEESVNTITGKPVAKKAPKKLMSDAAAATTIEDFIMHLMPSVPLYSLTGGIVQSPVKETVQNSTRYGIAAIEAALSGKGEDPSAIKRNKQKIDNEFHTVK